MISNKVIVFKSVSIVSVIALMLFSCAKKVSVVSESDPWKQKELIVKGISKTDRKSVV